MTLSTTQACWPSLRAFAPPHPLRAWAKEKPAIHVMKGPQAAGLPPPPPPPPPPLSLRIDNPGKRGLAVTTETPDLRNSSLIRYKQDNGIPRRTWRPCHTRERSTVYD